MKIDRYHYAFILLGLNLLTACGGLSLGQAEKLPSNEASIHPSKACMLPELDSFIQSFRSQCKGSSRVSGQVLKRYYFALRSLAFRSNQVEQEWVTFKTWVVGIPSLKVADVNCVQKMICGRLK